MGFLDHFLYNSIIENNQENLNFIMIFYVKQNSKKLNLGKEFTSFRGVKSDI